MDGHAAATGQVDDATDALERSLFQRAREVWIRRQAHHLEVRLADLRRIVAQTREVAANLTRTDTDLIDEELMPYLRDVVEQAQHNLETIDSNRERIDRIVQTQLNEQRAQLNETNQAIGGGGAPSFPSRRQ